MSVTEDIKLLFTGTTNEKLEVIERRTRGRLKSMLSVSEIPKSFEDIVYEIVLKRFNRIGNEGMSSYSQEGLSMAFPDSDFTEYQQEIDDYVKKNDPDLKNHRSAARFF